MSYSGFDPLGNILYRVGGNKAKFGRFLIVQAILGGVMMARKCWTEEEEKYLKENFEKYPIETIAKKLGRTNASISHKARKLGLVEKRQPNRGWTEKEENKLITMWGKVPVEKISEKLDRTVNAINHKASRLEITKKSTRWTDEEINYLSDNWGKFTLKTLCQELGRTEYGVLDMAVRILELGPSKDNQGKLTARVLAEAIGVSPAVVFNWLKRHGLKGSLKATRKKRKVWQIDVSDFWKWAKENQDRIDASLFEWGVLGAEPDWMQEKRRKDIMAKSQWRDMKNAL